MDKKCSKCQETKDLSQFRNCKKSKDGKKYYCLVCDDKIASERYSSKKDLLNDQQKKWQKKNKEKYLEYQKQYRLRKKEQKPQQPPQQEEDKKEQL
jgi:hypothetical protein